MANETITITCNADGTYTLASTEDPGEASGTGDLPLDTTVKTIDEVLELVRQELSDDGPEGSQAAWDAEAAQRGPDGQRAPASGAGPIQGL